MPLFAKIKGKEGAPKAPKAVAEALIAALPPNELIVGTSIAGPGFINLKISPAYLAKKISG